MPSLQQPCQLIFSGSSMEPCPSSSRHLTRSSFLFGEYRPYERTWTAPGFVDMLQESFDEFFDGYLFTTRAQWLSFLAFRWDNGKPKELGEMRLWWHKREAENYRRHPLTEQKRPENWLENPILNITCLIKIYSGASPQTDKWLYTLKWFLRRIDRCLMLVSGCWTIKRKFSLFYPR